MIIGTAEITDTAFVTHRTSYTLSAIKSAHLKKPFLLPIRMMSFCLGGFSLAFGDLLTFGEITVILGLIIAGNLIASQIGLLKLTSRELLGTDLGDAVWGQPKDLDPWRRKIIENSRVTVAEETP